MEHSGILKGMELIKHDTVLLGSEKGSTKKGPDPNGTHLLAIYCTERL